MIERLRDANKRPPTMEHRPWHGKSHELTRHGPNRQMDQLRSSQCMPEPKILSPEQVLLTTLVVKLAVMAALATMLVRYRRFRHILIFERRDWPDRLIFILFFGIPLSAGVVSRLLLNYNAADLTLEGAFVTGLIA